jgi:hypothetical protein
MAQFSMEIMRLTGSVLRGNQQGAFEMTALDLDKCHMVLSLSRKGPRGRFEEHTIRDPAELDTGMAYLHQNKLIQSARVEFVTVFSDQRQSRELFVWCLQNGGWLEYDVFKHRNMAQLETFLVKALLEKHTRDRANCGHSGSTVIRRALKDYVPFREAGDTDDKLAGELRSLMYRWRTDAATRPYGLNVRTTSRGRPGEEQTAYEWWFDEKIRHAYEDRGLGGEFRLNSAVGYWREIDPAAIKAMVLWFTVWTWNGVGLRFCEPYRYPLSKKQKEARIAELTKAYGTLKPTRVVFDDKPVPLTEGNDLQVLVRKGLNPIEAVRELVGYVAPVPEWARRTH